MIGLVPDGAARATVSAAPAGTSPASWAPGSSGKGKTDSGFWMPLPSVEMAALTAGVV